MIHILGMLYFQIQDTNINDFVINVHVLSSEDSKM